MLGGIFRQQQGMTNNGWFVDRIYVVTKAMDKMGFRIMLRMPSKVITKRIRSKHAVFLPTYRDDKIYKLLFLTTVVDEIYPVFVLSCSLHMAREGETVVCKEMATASSSSMASKDTGWYHNQNK